MSCFIGLIVKITKITAQCSVYFRVNVLTNIEFVTYERSRDDVTSGPACAVTWSAVRSPACRWLGTAAKFIMPGCASGMKANGPAAAAAAAAAAR